MEMESFKPILIILSVLAAAGFIFLAIKLSRPEAISVKKILLVNQKSNS